VLGGRTQSVADATHSLGHAGVVAEWRRRPLTATSTTVPVRATAVSCPEESGLTPCAPANTFVPSMASARWSMSENSEVLKRGYAAFNSGDVETVSEVFADDASWEGPNTPGVPMSGVNEGKGAVLQALAQIGQDFERFHVSPDQMIEEGGTIVVLSHVEARTKSGNDVKLPGVEIWRMSDGKATRVQSLLDTAELKKALDG
jgi:uncharacterized protein